MSFSYRATCNHDGFWVIKHCVSGETMLWSLVREEVGRCQALSAACMYACLLSHDVTPTRLYSVFQPNPIIHVTWQPENRLSSVSRGGLERQWYLSRRPWTQVVELSERFTQHSALIDDGNYGFIILTTPMWLLAIHASSDNWKAGRLLESLVGRPRHLLLLSTIPWQWHFF